LNGRSLYSSLISIKFEKFLFICIIYLFLELEKYDIPELQVKEWIWSKSNQYHTPDLVKAEQIGWGVPTIQRLWFGYVIFIKQGLL
jgi:hypothetical protein